MSAHVNLFKSSTDTTPVKVLSLAEALNAIQGSRYQKPVAKLRDLLATKGQQAYDKAKKQLAAVTFCGTFSPTRAKANLTTHSGIVHGDLDHLADLQATKHALCSDPHTVYCFTSPSGTGLKVGVQVEPVPDDTQYKHAWQAVADYHQRQYGITWDASGKDVCRLCYVSWDPDLYNNPDAQLFGVPPYHPPAPKPKPPPAPASDSLSTDRRQQDADRAMQTAVEMIDASVPPTPTSAGTRHEARRKAAYLLGGYIAGSILDYGEARAALAAAVERNTTDFTSAMHTIDDCLTAGQEAAISLEDLEAQRHQWLEEHRAMPQHRQLTHQDATQRQNGQQPATSDPGAPAIGDAADKGALPYSDYTNCLALVREHGQHLRYCFPWKSWLVWTGTHWQRDDTGSVHQAAKQTIKRLARHAEDLDDDAAVKALMAHVKKSLSKASLDALVRTAQDEPGIPVKPEALDMDPWLLNCTNGTLDLRTGTLRPQRQADLITKCLPIAYDPHAQCPTWEHFLWRIMGGSQGQDHPDMNAGELENRCKADDRARALIDFLQRAIGYTLTGSTREQCIFILHGKTKTGKSTFLATLRALLGPYGQQADMSSFMHKDRDEVRNDLADLAGSRVVCALESQEGRRLAESLVKQLTGGVDLYKARFLFQEHFTFKPQFKIFLGTNHKPLIKDTDSAIWERIRLVPFDMQIPKPERDKTLDERLQQELPGILAWAVRGCLEWQRLGELGEPKAVITATAQYRSDMDTIARFLEECCIVDKPEIAKVKASVLASAYQAWCKRTGEVPLANRDLITDLEERGYKRARGTANQYYWHGLGLVNTEEERYE